MCDVESRDAAGGALVIIVLNGRTSSIAVLDTEIAAAYIDGLSVGVRNQRLQSIGKPALHSGFQCVVVGIADALRVRKPRICPRHGSQRVNGRKISGLTARPSGGRGSRLRTACSDSVRTRGDGIGHVARTKLGRVSFSFVIKASILAAHVGGRKQQMGSELPLNFHMPLLRITVLVGVGIEGESPGGPRSWSRQGIRKATLNV